MQKFLLLILLAVSTTAQAWQPTQPVQIIVANPAGGSTDTIARIIAEGMETRSRHRFIVVNRPGAQGVIGARHVMNSLPDGHTLLLTGTTFLYANLLAVPNADYDPVRGLTHVGLIGTVPTRLFARRGIDGDLASIVNQVRQGRDFTWGVTFAGAEFAARMIAQSTGKNINIIRYNGSTQAYADVMGGHVDFILDSGTGGAIQEAVQSGRVRLMSTLDSRDRVSDSLDSILPGIVNVGWFGLSLPSKTAPEVTKFYQDLLNEQLADSAIRNRLNQIMIQSPRSSSSERFSRIIEDDAKKFQPIAHLLR